MDSTHARELAHQFIDRLLRFEHAGEEALDDLLALFADDAEVVNPALASAGERRVGRDELRRFWRTYHDVLGEAESEFAHVTTDDRSAGLFWTTRAAGRHGAGEAIRYDGATMLVFDDDGRIRHFRAYFNLGDLAHHPHRAGNPSPTHDEHEVSDPRQSVGYG